LYHPRSYESVLSSAGSGAVKSHTGRHPELAKSLPERTRTVPRLDGRQVKVFTAFHSSIQSPVPGFHPNFIKPLVPSSAEDSLSALNLIVELFPDHCCWTSLAVCLKVEDVFLCRANAVPSRSRVSVT
jgi:hypothetical protein